MSIGVVQAYLIQLAQQQVPTLLTNDVILTVNGTPYKGLTVVKQYLQANYVPVTSQGEPSLLPDGRVELRCKVKKFLLTIPIRSRYTVKENKISFIEVSVSL